MTAREGSSDSSENKQAVEMRPQQEPAKPQDPQSYMTKKVVIGGQTVTLYSANGVTWLSSPDQLPEMMARLENARILLTDPKAAEAAAAAAPKATAARYRMKGPKPRPILQPDGTLLPPTERLAPPAADTKVKVESGEVEVVDDSPAARIRQLRAGTLEGSLAPSEKERDEARGGKKMTAKGPAAEKSSKVVPLNKKGEKVAANPAKKALPDAKSPREKQDSKKDAKKNMAIATGASKSTGKPVVVKGDSKKTGEKSSKSRPEKGGAAKAKSAVKAGGKKAGKKR